MYSCHVLLRSMFAVRFYLGLLSKAVSVAVRELHLRNSTGETKNGF